MLLPDAPGLRVYLHCAPVDMRRQRNGLAALARAVIGDEVFSGALFCFIGRRRDKLKILYWHRNGFVVWYKVIEGVERFPWPRHSADATVNLTAEQLAWLLEGIDVWKMKPHRALIFSHIS
jgi:transposase